MEMSPNAKEAQLWLLSDIFHEEDNNMSAQFNDIAFLAQVGKRNVFAPMNTRPQVPSQGFSYPVCQNLIRSSFPIPIRPEATFSDQNRIGCFNEQRFRAPVDLKEMGVGGGWKSIGTGVFIPTARVYRVKNDSPPPVQEENVEEIVDTSPELCLPQEWTY